MFSIETRTTVAFILLIYVKAITVSGFSHDVEIPPSFLTMPPREIIHIPGRPLHIPCTAIGFPEPRYEWYNNGQLLSIGTYADANSYAPKPGTKNYFKSASEESKLSKTLLWDFSRLLNTGRLKPGWINCVAANPKGKALTPPTRLRIAELSDSGFCEPQTLIVTFDHSGTFTCQLHSSTSFSTAPISADFKLLVESEPFFGEKPTDLTVPIGGSGQLHCSPNSLVLPKPDVTWYANGDRIEKFLDGRRKRLIGNTLEFSYLTLRDTAVFQCNISNKNGFAFANAYLNVWDSPPAIVDGPPERTVCVEKQALALRCRTMGAPSAVVIWSKDGNTQLRSNGNGTGQNSGRLAVQTDGSLLISDLICTHPAVELFPEMRVSSANTDQSLKEDVGGWSKTTAKLPAEFTVSPIHGSATTLNVSLVLSNTKAINDDSRALNNGSKQVPASSLHSLILNSSHTESLLVGSTGSLNNKEKAARPNRKEQIRASALRSIQAFAVQFKRPTDETWEETEREYKKSWMVVRNLIPGQHYNMRIILAKTPALSFVSPVRIFRVPKLGEIGVGHFSTEPRLQSELQEGAANVSEDKFGHLKSLIGSSTSFQVLLPLISFLCLVLITTAGVCCWRNCRSQTVEARSQGRRMLSRQTVFPVVDVHSPARLSTISLREMHVARRRYKGSPGRKEKDIRITDFSKSPMKSYNFSNDSRNLPTALDSPKKAYSSSNEKARSCAQLQSIHPSAPVRCTFEAGISRNEQTECIQKETV
ncbi:ATP-dependent DNA helicase chl1 [Sparganum proliferum]